MWLVVRVGKFNLDDCGLGGSEFGAPLILYFSTDYSAPFSVKVGACVMSQFITHEMCFRQFLEFDVEDEGGQVSRMTTEGHLGVGGVPDAESSGSNFSGSPRHMLAADSQCSVLHFRTERISLEFRKVIHGLTNKACWIT
jgi:hypothetical protein